MKERILTKESSIKTLGNNSKINQLSFLKFELNNFQRKEEKLFGNKSFLEILLGLIKHAQKDVIINNDSKCSHLSHIKHILNVFKNDLLGIKKEKEKELNLNEIIKTEKKNNYYIKTRPNQFTINSDQNNINTNFDSLMTESNEVESFEEITQLKMMNFKVRYEIKKVCNLIRRKQIEINYYKISNGISRKKKKIIYINNNDDDKINQILHNKLISRRNTFIECATMKNNQDNYINFLLDKIAQKKSNLRALKRLIERKMNSEKNKIFIETIVENTENDEVSINNNNIYCNSTEFDSLNKKLIKDDSDSIGKNNSNKDSTCNEETNSNSCEKNGITVK